MSKSILTRRSPTKRQIVAKAEAYNGDQKEEYQMKQRRSEPNPQSSYEMRKKSAREVNKQKHVDNESRRCVVDAPPVLSKPQSLDWCDCEGQTNRQCDACILLGTRQMELHRQKVRLARADYIGFEQTKHNSTTQKRDDSGQLWNSRLEHFADPRRNDFVNSQIPERDIWSQMQQMLASSEEVFPSVGHRYEDDIDFDVTGWQMMPDLNSGFPDD